MTLVPIQHERRLSSPAEAEALMHALGEKIVSVRGFHTRDPARIERLVAGVLSKREHTISFEGGVLGTAARSELAALTAARFGYLDVRTSDANLRVWPKRYSWVHSKRDRAAASAALGIPLSAGANTVGDAQVTITEDGRGYPVYIDTKSIPTALRMFDALSGDRIEQGFIDGMHESAKPLLLRFLLALATCVHGALEIDLATARALTELFAGEKVEWQAGGLLIDFPEGQIHGFLTSPNIGDRDREKWQARTTKMLRRAKLIE